MTAAERLARAEELLGQVVAEIEDAEQSAPSFAVDSLRLLRAEAKVAQRRVGNVRKVLAPTGTAPDVR